LADRRTKPIDRARSSALGVAHREQVSTGDAHPAAVDTVDTVDTVESGEAVKQRRPAGSGR